VSNCAATENQNIYLLKIALNTLRQSMYIFVESKIRRTYVTLRAVRCGFAGNDIKNLAPPSYQADFSALFRKR
jgi:hypothetical protein